MAAHLSLRPVRLASTLLAFVLLVGCTGEQAAVEPEGSFNDADVAFLESMVPHHAQAVEMAELVPDRTAHPDELTELADQIITSQQAEIDAMNEQLTEAGAEPVEAGADHGGGHGGSEMDGMAGMMAPEDMEELASLDGNAFDLRFLEMMTVHHEGAIEQAEDVLGSGESPEVASLAEEIIDAQRAEIEQMQSWRQDWSA